MGIQAISTNQELDTIDFILKNEAEVTLEISLPRILSEGKTIERVSLKPGESTTRTWTVLKDIEKMKTLRRTFEIHDDKLTKVFLNFLSVFIPLMKHGIGVGLSVDIPKIKGPVEVAFGTWYGYHQLFAGATQGLWPCAEVRYLERPEGA
jgi:hypothetical protein